MTGIRSVKLLLSLLVVCVLLALPGSTQAVTTIHDNAATSIGTFTGGDVGEGLDLDGTFLYAINFDATVPNQQVRDANFVDIGASGATGATGNLAEGHGANPDYGATTNDDNLEAVMNGSHWGTLNTVKLPGLTEGQDYKLQLLFNDPATHYDRDFDIRLPSVNPYPNDPIIDNIHPQNEQGYFGEGAGGPTDGDVNLGVVVTHTFQQPIGRGTELQIGLDNYGQLPPDEGYLNRDAVIAGLTLETVPEPSSLFLLALSAVAVLLVRHRR